MAVNVFRNMVNQLRCSRQLYLMKIVRGKRYLSPLLSTACYLAACKSKR